MKNSNDTIGNRTRDLTACSAVSQRTAPPREKYGGSSQIFGKFVVPWSDNTLPDDHINPAVCQGTVAMCQAYHCTAHIQHSGETQLAVLWHISHPKEGRID